MSMLASWPPSGKPDYARRTGDHEALYSGTAEPERHDHQGDPDQQGKAVGNDEGQVPDGRPVADPEHEAGQQDREIADRYLARGTLAQHAADLQDRREAHQHAPGRGGDGEYGHYHGRSFGKAP